MSLFGVFDLPGSNTIKKEENNYLLSGGVGFDASWFYLALIVFIVILFHIYINIIISDNSSCSPYK